MIKYKEVSLYYKTVYSYFKLLCTVYNIITCGRSAVPIRIEIDIYHFEGILIE